MNYNKNEIKFCEYCGGTKFYEKIADRTEFEVIYKDFICKNCEARVNFWKFGLL